MAGETQGVKVPRWGWTYPCSWPRTVSIHSLNPEPL